MIINFLLRNLNVKQGTYIDIGAHHPFVFSNTQFFYEHGWTGINIEANPFLLDNFRVHRKNDINLNIGVLDKAGELSFYIMKPQTMSTFSEEEVESLVKNHKMAIDQVVRVPVKSICEIIKTYSPDKNPDVLFIDVEGCEEIILQSINYNDWSPLVICCETVEYSTTGIPEKNKSIIELLGMKGYMVFADTYINTIFVLKDKFASR